MERASFSWRIFIHEYPIYVQVCKLLIIIDCQSVNSILQELELHRRLELTFAIGFQ